MRAKVFFVNFSGIEGSDIRSLELLLSSESISKGRSEGLLSGLFGNENLQRLFLGCWKGHNWVNLWELMKERHIDLESVDVSVVSFEALDSLLLNESISIESEDSLLCLILTLDLGYRNLLRHINIERPFHFGGRFEDFARIKVAIHYRMDRPFSFLSQLADHFRRSGDFGRVPRKAFRNSLAGQVAMISKRKNYTADVTVTQIL
jgi:hypothetical protein